MSPRTTTGHRQGSTAWTLAITGIAGFMASLDNLVVTTALPRIREDLGGALHDLEWTVSAYTLTFAALMMLGAALGDRYGRRRMFLVGLAVFTAASAGAALAPDIDALLAARAAQGVGAAVMMPLTLRTALRDRPAGPACRPPRRTDARTGPPYPCANRPAGLPRRTCVSRPTEPARNRPAGPMRGPPREPPPRTAPAGHPVPLSART